MDGEPRVAAVASDRPERAGPGITAAVAGDPLAGLDALIEAVASTAVERDRAGGTAKRERDLLRGSGLLGLSVPRQLGGGGASWATVLQVVRRLAQVDSSLAHLFGFHHLMLATLRLFGTPAQWEPLLRQTVRERWFWGNALNPLDRRTRVTPASHDRGRPGYRIDGSKSFCSGASDSDRLIVSALQGETEPLRLIVAHIPTARAGVRVLEDWDCFGQRQTDSGGVEFSGVWLGEDEILRTPGPLGSPFASLRPCLAQLILANVYLGLAQGALAEARRYTRSQSRAWIASPAATATADPYVLRRYGELAVDIEGARLLTDHAVRELDTAWQVGEALAPEGRGTVAVAVALAKVAGSRAGLQVTEGIFEVTGARATLGRERLDRFWRNVRVHTLHDPVDYKLRDLGDYTLNGTLPTPSFYS